MKKLLYPVYMVTAIVIIYVAAIFTSFSISLILFVFSISPTLIIWMAYKVLTSDIEVNSTFEEKWYEDET
ncbi:hypothetical protein ACFSKL_04685 [Belliella marina]|uniref:Uncharacterized protein n=1 Tax=Belliella marina TaxID=1644146 RepID=A0ABW4VHB7_9BACT